MKRLESKLNFLFILIFSWIALTWLPAAEARVLAFVPKALPQELTVIDTATDTVIDNIPLPIRPAGVAVNPPRRRAYIWGQTSGPPTTHLVLVLDTETLTVVDTIPVPSVDTIVASPDGSTFYMVVLGDAIWVMRASDNGFTTSIRGSELERVSSLAVSADGSRLYAPSRPTTPGRPFVAVIDTSTNTIIDGWLDTQDQLGQDIVLDPTGMIAYVTGRFQKIFVVDIASGSILETISAGLPAEPQSLALNADGSLLFLTTGVDDALLFVDTATRTVVASTPSGSGTAAVAVHPDGSRVYVINCGSTFVSVFDPGTHVRIQRITTGMPACFDGDFLGDFIDRPPEIFADGFESGDTSGWSASTVAANPPAPIALSLL